MKKTLITALTVIMIAAVVVLMVGCVHFNITGGSGDAGQKAESENAAESNDAAESQDAAENKDAAESKDPADDVLKAVVPPKDFDPVGEYQDRTSQRATMTITPEGEEGHYSVVISWGSSAFETTIWEFDGNFDWDSGMLSYNNCVKYELKVDENGKQHEEVKYENGDGALLYYEYGFHWDNKKDNAGKDCFFFKYDDLSDTIIEEAEE